MSQPVSFPPLSPEEYKEVAAQLANPRGEMGALVAERMNENNASITSLMYEHLKVSSASRVLEIGFGNGKLLSNLIAKVGHVDGIDISEDMIEAAKQLQTEAIASGKLTVSYGRSSSIPFPDATFDAVCTANTLYFWEDVTNDLAEIKRVMKPGGHLALGIRSRSKMEQMPFTAYGFTLYEREDVEKLLTDNGFVNVGHVHIDQADPVDNLVVWGEKAA